MAHHHSGSTAITPEEPQRGSVMLIFLLPFPSPSSFSSMKSTEALYAHLARNPLSHALQHRRPVCQETLSCYQDRSWTPRQNLNSQWKRQSSWRVGCYSWQMWQVLGATHGTRCWLRGQHVLLLRLWFFRLFWLSTRNFRITLRQSSY